MKIFVDSYLGERKNKCYADFFKTVKMQVKYSLGFFIFHNLATSFKRKLTEQKHQVELSNRKQINKVNKCMLCVHIIMLTIIALKKLMFLVEMGPTQSGLIGKPQIHFLHK